MHLRDRISSRRTGRFPDELTEVVDKLVLAENEIKRLRHDFHHVKDDRDRHLSDASAFRRLYEAAELTIKAQQEDLAHTQGRLVAAYAELLANGLRR